MKLVDPDQPWYCVRCNTSEQKTERELQLAGFQTYLPWRRYEIPNKRTRTVRLMEVPLIPRLIFIAVPLKNFGRARDVTGVSDFLKIQGAPISIPGMELADLQSREWDLQFDDTRAARVHRKEEAVTRKETYKQKFPIGSPALFEGIFGDLVGIVVKHDKTGRFKLEIAAHGTTITVDADPEKLRPAA